MRLKIILLALALFSIACDETIAPPVITPVVGGNSTYPTHLGAVGGCNGGPLGQARLAPEERGGLLNDLLITGCGQSGERWHVYNGPITITGTLTFSRVYSARANIHTPSYQGQVGHYGSPPVISRCPVVGRPYHINCQTQAHNGNFRNCSVLLDGQNYQLSGSIIHSKQTGPAEYDVVNVSVCGLCGHAGYGAGCTGVPTI